MSERFAVDADIETGVERKETPTIDDMPINELSGNVATVAALAAWSEVSVAPVIESTTLSAQQQAAVRMLQENYKDIRAARERGEI